MVRENYFPSKPHGADPTQLVWNRLPRVFVGHLLCGGIGSPRVQDPDGVEDRGGGFDEVLPRDIHLPLRRRDDLESWAGKCEKAPLRAAPINIQRVSPGVDPTSSSFVSSSLAYPEFPQPYTFASPRSAATSCEFDVHPFFKPTDGHASGIFP